MPSVTEASFPRLLVAVLISFLLACRDVHPTELPGRYVLSADWGQSTLILLPDKTMAQEVRTKAGSVRKISGSWDFTDGFLVFIKPCLSFSRAREGTEMDGCGLGVDVTPLGEIRISADTQNSLSYGKVSEH
jgi:hypothetical protein